MNSQPCVVIDTALRFARSNPELLHYAHQNAGAPGCSVDDLLRQAIDRVVAERAALRSTRPALDGRPLLRAV